MRVAPCTPLVLAALSFWALPQGASAQYEELLNEVPFGANTLILIDTEGLLNTPLARQEGWAKKRADDFTSGRVFVPPNARRVVMAGSFDLDANRSSWELALMELDQAVSLRAVAQAEKGYLDEVAGQQVAWTPRGAYVRKLGTNTAGVLFPANRRTLSQWIRGRSGQLTRYLRGVVRRRGVAGPQLTMAMDLEDVLAPHVIRDRLQRSDAMSRSKLDPERVADVAASIKGLTLDVTVRDRATGTVTVQFGHDAALLADVAKELFLEVLERKGAYIDDFEDWTVSVQGDAVVFEGAFTKSGLLRISAIVETPSLPLDDTGRDRPQVDGGDPKLYASQQHYKSVQALLKDVRTKKGIDVKTFGQYAMWIELYAKRIDRLPLVDVDEGLQDYSAEVAGLLRKMAAGYKGYGIRSGARAAQYYQAGTYEGGYEVGPYGGYGYGHYTDNGYRYVAAERRRVRAEERAKSATTAVDIWQAIDEATSEIRREMTQKYRVEF